MNPLLSLLKKVKAFSRSIKTACAELSEELGLTITKPVLIKFIKKLGYRWKRFRKSLKSKQDAVIYEQQKAKLKQLIELHKENYIDLYFADESSFNMEGCIPYGWQPKGEYIELTPSKTTSINVFGLMSLDNRLEAYTYKGSATSDLIIAFIDDFASGLKQPTALVLDNAPVHHSYAFEEKIADWEELGLKILFLPPYSPHLNPIEILWRKMKYEWLHFEHIDHQDELENQVNQILYNFGNNYTISFKELEIQSVDFLI